MEPTGKSNPKGSMMQSSRNQRFHTGPTVFRDPNAPPRPGGVITLREDYKGRILVDFSSLPLAPKRTRGPNKRDKDPELLSSDQELDTTESHGTRLNVPTGKLKSQLPSSKETARRTKISKTMLAKRGPDVKKPMTAAERKRKQRVQQKADERGKNALMVRAIRERDIQ